MTGMLAVAYSSSRQHLLW